MSKKGKDSRPWFRLTAEYPDHPVISELSDAAFRLHVTAIAHSARNLTDGRIGAKRMEALAGGGKRGRQAVEELARCGLLVPDTDSRVPGWVVHDYLEHQSSRAEVEAAQEQKRAAGAKRQHQRWHVDAQPDGSPARPNPAACEFCREEGLPAPDEVPRRLRSVGE